MISQNKLQELLHYDADTGVFTWRVANGRKGLLGKVAGTVKLNGYVEITINYKKFKAHRLAWIYFNGEDPSGEIDHINRCTTDNRINNLRAVSSSLNKENRLKQSNNKSGYKGVSWHQKAGKWQAHVRTHGRSNYLGLFVSAEDAYAAYQSAAAKLHEINPCSGVAA